MAGFGIDTSIAFQSTPPVKAATICIGDSLLRAVISIHAAREGGDGCIRRNRIHGDHFNPRRP